MAGPAQRDELAGRLAEFLEVDCDDRVRAAADSILERLDSLGLAEPLPAPGPLEPRGPAGRSGPAGA